MQIKISKRILLLIICLYLFVFQNALQLYLGVLQYFDELFALLAIPLFLYKFKFKVNKKKNNIYFLSFLIVLIGLLSNIIYKYQNFSALISDCLIFCKFFLTMYVSSKLFYIDEIIKYKKIIYRNVKVIISILFVLTVANYTFGIFPTDGYRYGVMCNQLFYSHSTYLAGVCVFLLSTYIFARGRVFDFYVFMIMFILLSTFRMKAIGSMVIISFLLVQIYIKKSPLSISKYVIAGLAALTVSYNTLIDYFSFGASENARQQLLFKSIFVAKDHFPIGSGFATFGSFFSGESYSPLYYKYGLNLIWGLSEGFHDFVADSFWPMVIGQFGFLGLALYIFILFDLFNMIQKQFNENGIYIYSAKMICYFYLLISSIAESSYCSSIAMPLAIIIGINSIGLERKNQ